MLTLKDFLKDFGNKRQNCTGSKRERGGMKDERVVRVRVKADAAAAAPRVT